MYAWLGEICQKGEIEEMTEAMVYRCDVCGRVYETSFEATCCETAHVKIKRVSGCNYRAKQKYPECVDVVFENGIKIRYER